MKFDLIVGNPPYEGAGKPLYLQILATLMPYAKEVVWICPTQWTKAWKDIPYTAELKKTTLNCLIDHENMPSPFEDANLFNEVAVYHFGESDKYESFEDLYYERFNSKAIAKSIISKFISFGNHLSDFVNSGNGDYYAVMARVRGNVLLGKPKWNWVTLFGEDQRSSSNPPKVTTSQKQYKYFRFATENEWRNFIDSTETDISAFALYAAKISLNLNSKDIALMPWLGDYTRSWNDDQIAAELGLTKEELDYIHEEMKNFGWKCAKKVNK